MEIAEFLLARIAEDEAAARAGDRGDVEFPSSYIDTFGARTTDDDLAEFLHRFTPDRVLAECEAKRRRVRALNERAPHPNAVPLLRKLLALEALPYADHEDYRQEWKP